jgi:hypothetical protein
MRVVEWHQSVEHYTRINVEGRRLAAHCRIDDAGDLELSNKQNLEELGIEVLIFDTPRMQKELSELNGGLGSFRYYANEPAKDDIPAIDAFVSCWFCLNSQSYDDAWQQVLNGGYTECGIRIEVGPVEFPSIGWLWNVEQQPFLIIGTVSVQFKRPVPKQAVADAPTSFWRRK